MTPERDELYAADECGAILIDEGLAGNRSLMESVVEFCMSRNYRVRILINGGPEQLPPVVPWGSVSDVVSASLLSSWVYRSATQRFVLTSNYRQGTDRPWSVFTASLANASAPTMADHVFTRPDEHMSAVAAPLVGRVWVQRGGAQGTRDVAHSAVRWLFGTRADGSLDVTFNSETNARCVMTQTNTVRNFWNDVINEIRAAEPGADRFTYEASNGANIRGGDDMTEELAMEALRDEASMFDRADHSVPVSSLDLGVGDLVMLPVRPALAAQRAPLRMRVAAHSSLETPATRSRADERRQGRRPGQEQGDARHTADVAGVRGGGREGRLAAPPLPPAVHLCADRAPKWCGDPSQAAARPTRVGDVGEQVAGAHNPSGDCGRARPVLAARQCARRVQPYPPLCRLRSVRRSQHCDVRRPRTCRACAAECGVPGTGSVVNTPRSSGPSA